MNRLPGIIKAVLLSLFIFSSCQIERPKGLLSDTQMKDILYDFHIAKAMGEKLSYSQQYKRPLYIESVFRKHGVTQADFDSTMAWYSRYPESLTKVYEAVLARAKEEQKKIDVLISIRDGKPVISQQGDSVDVWIWQRVFQLSGMPLNNCLAFKLPSDENFEARDTFKLSLNYRYVDQQPDSSIIPVMALQIAYAKDTVLQNICYLDSLGKANLTLSADSFGDIKEVSGFIYYSAPKNKASLLLHDIQLMRYHATADSLAVEKTEDQEATSKKNRSSLQLMTP